MAALVQAKSWRDSVLISMISDMLNEDAGHKSY
jgi:hypothetical protein